MTQDAFRPDAWTRACDRFTEDLNEDEKRLYFQATPENIFYEASAVDKISHDSSRTRKFFKKLQPFVESIEQYGAALDVISNTYPLALSPLWGTIRIVLHLACETGQYFERISTMFIDIGEVLPRLHVYERLFPRHERLVQALSVIYCDLIQFCSDAKHALRRVKRSSLSLTWKTFDRQFGDQIEKFRKHQKLVEKEVTTSHMIESADSRSVVLANHMQVSKEHEAGCGKSVLMSTMVKQQLQSKIGSIVYFFCDYSDPATLLTINVYRALLKQLFDTKKLSDDVKQRIAEQSKRSSHGPNEHDLASYLSESIEACGSLCIMVDGLDECSDEIQICLSEQVSRWSDMGKSVVKVIVTCREEEKPLRHLRTFANLKFDLSILYADIEAFISNSVESCISKGELTIRNRELESLITSKLSEKAQGMFLWVYFQLQDLCEATSDQAIRELLDHLPNGLHDTYVRILEKVERGTSQPNKILVQQALQWVAFARRPLTLPELQEAVAFDSKDDHWEADKIPDGDKLIGLCRGLIIRGQDGKVRFAHHTVRQHLLRPAVQDECSITPFQVDPDGLSAPHLIDYYFTTIRAEFRRAVICATYLCFSDFDSAMVKANEEKVVTMHQIFKSGGPIAIPATVGLKRQLFHIPYRFLGGNGNIRMPEIDFSKYSRNLDQHQRAPPQMRDKYALLDYVIQYWPWHTKQQLSKTGLKLNLPVDVYHRLANGKLLDKNATRPDLHIGCLPAFQKFWDVILHKNLHFELRPWGLNHHFGPYGCQGCPPIESEDRTLHRSRWTSLMHWAAETGNVPLIQASFPEIMEHLYHERYHPQTLKIACAHDQPEVISYMFTAGAKELDIFSRRERKWRSQATDLGLRIRQTPYLIADWIDFCCKSGALEGLIALTSFSEYSRNDKVLRGIHLRGAFMAACNGRSQVVEWLLDGNYIDYRAEDATTMTLLHVAARDGHASVVKQILQRRSELLDLQDDRGETPLILASQGGHTNAAQLLLGAGAKVLIEGMELIPLPYGASTDLFLQGLGTCEAAQYPTAIHFAAANGHHNVLSELLMSETFEKEIKERGFSPLLSTLATMDNEKGVLALDPLECAATEPKAVCSRALHLAVSMGHEQVVRLLLQKNADPDIAIPGGVTPLHLAAKTGNTAIIVLLLDSVQSNERETAQPDLYRRVNRGLVSDFEQTPLELAIVNGHSEAVEKLIDYGANFQLGTGSKIDALQLAVVSPKAGSATIRAVCVGGVPRSMNGSSFEMSGHYLLRYTIEHSSPAKLQTLFDLGLRDGNDMGPEREKKHAEPLALVLAAIMYNKADCLEVLLANSNYQWQSLTIAARLTRENVPPGKETGQERSDLERLHQILEKRLTEMRSPTASGDGIS